MTTVPAVPADPPPVVSQLGGAVAELLSWLHDVAPRSDRGNEVVELVAAHLGDARRTTSVVVRDVPPFEQVNLQVALDAWIAAPGREVAVHGLALNEQYGPTGLQDIVHGEVNGPLGLSAPDVVDLPSGPDRTQACWRRALLLVHDARGAYVVLLRGPQRHEPGMDVQVAGLPTAQAQEVHRELAELRSRLNVYRGQLLEMHGNGTIEFPALPATAREDVVLPDHVLRRVERHTVDIADRRAELQAAGQHLKRGLLLYGPPGTGKTHTTRYLVQRLAGTTVFLLSGRALHLIAMVTELARELQPSVVVLEDVDLVAEDRGYGDGSSPVLFELLDAMDGAAADADLLFLLTTNRADLLEPALAARPGRVDVAVEIGLPDPDARRRLFEVYSRGVPLRVEPADVEAVVERTDGVTASFLKELVRRAVLESLHERPGALEHVTGAHLSRALDDLLDSTQTVTRALLGVPADQSGPPMSAPMDRGHFGHGGAAWLEAGEAYGSACASRSDRSTSRDAGGCGCRRGADGSDQLHPPAVETAMTRFGPVPLTPTAFLDRARVVHRDQVALVDGDVRRTYAELADRCERLAGALAALGVGPGRPGLAARAQHRRGARGALRRAVGRRGAERAEHPAQRPGAGLDRRARRLAGARSSTTTSPSSAARSPSRATATCASW